MEDLKIKKEDYAITLVNELDEVLAYVTFPLVEEGVVNINRTFVDASLRGKGIASKLMDLVYEELVNRNLKARITCSYAVKYFGDNQDKQKILKK